jgi:hypothetical protein
MEFHEHCSAVVRGFVPSKKEVTAEGGCATHFLKSLRDIREVFQFLISTS